jgi:hypothetical protein
MKLTIFNSEKQATTSEPEKEKALEEHKRQQEEALKLVERE